MEIGSEVKFADEIVKTAYLELDSGKFQDKQLKEHLDRAVADLRKNAFTGIQVPKRLIPREYHLKFGQLGNLWKYNLPGAWRLLYTVKQDELVVLTIVLEWMSHKDYERRVGY